MIPLSTLRTAAFWAQAVCLECGTVQGHSIDPDEPVAPCEECQSGDVQAAETVLRIYNLVTPEGE
jgi:hypothetical protein